MANVLILGGARETAMAVTGLVAAGHAVQVYAQRDVDRGGAPHCVALRDGLAWADGVLDTSHVFDADMRQVARALAPDVPACRFGRAPWVPQDGDVWTAVPDIAGAVAALPAGARVFAATGRDSAEVLAHHDGPVFLRQLNAHDDTPPANCTFVFGEGPFAVDDEIRLFQALNIDVVLARNIGGQGSFPKLAAARALGLPALLLHPAAWEFGPPVTTMDAVLDWAGAL
ncbi:precorrin-6A/cobalt-precorrin-6A reductase [Tateyamaria sp. SN6-1]|uniref:precorrin-6A/cobalt-precorrin-6A reductase n=1 Tax=Tateyamaria sp. SN6-1 TaxID=3092148 RepID=UPI0039F5F026